jgi:hypothetical protein
MHGFAVIDGFALDDAAEEQGHASNSSQQQQPPEADSGSNNCDNNSINSGSGSSCRSHTLQRALEEARTLYRSNLMAHAGMKASASSAAASTVAAAATSSSSVGSSAGEPVPAVASSSSPVAASSASSSTPEPPAAAASTAAAAGGWKSASLRGDHHLWLHADNASERARSPALFALLDRLDALRGELNHVLLPPTDDGDGGADGDDGSGSGSSAGWKASSRSQVQLACYRGLGSRYVAHRDSVPGQAPHRRITAILYLNQDWRGRDEHGGCLRLFTKQQQPQLDADADDAGDAASRRMLPYFTTTVSAGLEQPQPPPADSIFFAPSAPDAASAPSAAAAPSAPASPSSSSSSPLPTWIDLAPIAHRLLLFSSAEMLHEVRPSHAEERFAITLWME